jgi:DNA-binding protein H-NS
MTLLSVVAYNPMSEPVEGEPWPGRGRYPRSVPKYTEDATYGMRCGSRHPR